MRHLRSLFLVVALPPLMLLISSARGETLQWETWVEVQESASELDTLWFGIHPEGTDGIDPSLGEVELPPLPPTGTFDARFTGASLGNGVKQDIRINTLEEKTYAISWQRAVSGNAITLSWDREHLPAGSFTLKDPFGGVLFNVDMTTTDSLQVTNAMLTSALLLVVPEEEEENTPPVADAGSDQIVDEGDLVVLDGSGSSDADDDSLTYRWTQIEGASVTLSDSTAVTPTFVAPAGPDTVSFALVVNDGTEESTPDTVKVAVRFTGAPTYYVSPNGNNTFGDGSESTPWRTIQHAVDQADHGDIIKVMDDDDETTDDYIENITVNKSLTIARHSDTGSNPQVKTSSASTHVFKVTSDSVTIKGLDIYGTTEGYGIYLDGVGGCTIQNTRCGWDSNHRNRVGIYVGSSSDNSLSDNICNSNDSDGIMVNYSDSNALSGNTCSSNSYGISLYSSNDNTLSDNTCSNNSLGIQLNSSSDNTLSDNTCASSNAEGIVVYQSSSSNTLSGNTCTLNSSSGISVTSYSSRNTLSTNTCTSNNNGIMLTHSSSNILSGNICTSNNYSGIYLNSSNTNNVLSSNTCSNNATGVNLMSSGQNTLSANTCTSNDRGILVNSSSDNNIYLNNFNNNVNAYSVRSTNTWNSPTKVRYLYEGTTQTGYMGNYYSDYNGIDSKGNGIGDSAYDLSGDEPDDEYPLVQTTDNYSIENHAPMADAGEDQTVIAEELATLYGSGSYDPDGDSFTYQWTQDTSKNPVEVTLSDVAVENPTFTPSVAGIYAFVLVVNDGVMDSEPDTVMVTVLRVPVARAGSDQRAMIGDIVTLDGSASHNPEGDPLIYQWGLEASNPSEVSLSDDSSMNPTFIPAVPGMYGFVLVVSNRIQDSVPDTVWVIVNTTPPTIANEIASVYTNSPPIVTDSFYVASEWESAYGSVIHYPDTMTDIVIRVTNTESELYFCIIHHKPIPLFHIYIDANHNHKFDATDKDAPYEDIVLDIDDGMVQSQATDTGWWTALAPTDPQVEYSYHEQVVRRIYEIRVPMGLLDGVDLSAGQDTVGLQTYCPLGNGGYWSGDQVYGASFGSPRGNLSLSKTVPVVISLPDTSSLPGSTIMIPITVSDAAGIAGGELVLSYNPDILTPVDVHGTELTQGFTMADTVKTPGKLGMILVRGVGIAGGRGSLLDVTFEVNATATPGDTSALVLDAAAFYDEETQPFMVTVTRGLFTVFNRSPVADAGEDQTISTGDTITLDGSGSSDADGGSLTYRWTQITGTSVTLSDSTAVTPTFVAPAGPDTLSFTLVVNDGTVDSAPDTVKVTVQDVPSVLQWTRWIEVQESASELDTLWLGIHPEGTDGIDPSLGEVELPPLPPTGTFDARFTGASLGNGVKQDIRINTLEEKTYTISWQRAASGNVITLSWDREHLPGGSFTLKDPFGGVLFNVDMTTVDSLQVTNAMLASALILVTPAGPVPVPDIEVDPLALAFGEVATDSMSARSVTVGNVGGADLQVTNITLTDDPASGTQFSRTDGVEVPFTLVPGTDTTLTVTFTPGAVGTFSGTVVISSDDPDEPSVEVSLSGTGKAEDHPEHFTFRSNTGDSYSILILSATINDVPLEVGDEIGVFTPAGLCAGSAVWSGEATGLAAWVDDSQTPEVDGFTAGEEMRFRVWDQSADREVPARATYVEGDGKYGTGSSAVVNLAGVSIQEIRLADGWSWISFNIEPEDLSIPAVMASCENLVLMQNRAGQFYRPDYGYNGIGDLNVLDGYKVYLSGPDTAQVEGSPVDPATGIPLIGGWNFISYLPTVPMDAKVAFAPIVDKLKIVQDDDGKFYNPTYGFSNMGNVQAGEGYKLYLSESATFVYPSGASKPVAYRERIEPVPHHFTFASRTGESYSVLILSGTGLDAGDEIGAFTQDGLCVGGGMWDGAPLGVAAWMDDIQTPVVDGYRKEDQLRFRIWDAEEDREYEPGVSYVEGTGRMGAGPGAVVRMSAISTPEQYVLMQNCPNPFNPETTIRYCIPKAGRIVVSVYNASGQKIRALWDGWTEAGGHSLLWDGKDALGQDVAAGIYLCRMEAGTVSRTRKMILLK